MQYSISTAEPRINFIAPRVWTTMITQMYRQTTIIICICLLAMSILTGCYRSDEYGVDPMLEHSEVKAYIATKKEALLKEYNDSKRHKVPVVDVDLELFKKHRDTERAIIVLSFTQQVRDEFGKRIALFEERKIRVSLKSVDKNSWKIIGDEFF